MFIINATNRSGEKGTIVPDAGFHYSKNLNEFNEAEIKISGSGVVRRGLMQVGTEIEIIKNGVLDFLGVVDTIDKLDAGTISVHCSGYEFWLGKEKYEGTHSPWDNVASATIFNNIINESNYWNIGSVASGFNTDFRLSQSQSLWNGITNLSTKTQQDVSLNYNNKQISIVNHLGSSTSVATYNDGINISNLRYTEGYPLGNNIVVYGKGDGEAQIKGTASDSTSIAEYGKITRPVIDRSVISVSEADRLAEAELKISKNPTEIYDFELNNPYENINLGDVITLNSTDKDISNKLVRIVSIERGETGGNEFCSVQVTNPDYKQMIKTRNKILSGLKKENIDNTTYMQGNTNTLTFEAMINANNTAPLRLGLYIPEYAIKDEIGKIDILKFTMSYEVDKFRSNIGVASETSDEFTNAGISNSSQNANHGLNNDSENAGHTISNALNPGITNLTSNGYITSRYSQSMTADNNWRTAGWLLTVGSTPMMFHSINLMINIERFNSGGGYCATSQLIRVRLENDDTGAYFPDSTGITLMDFESVNEGVSGDTFGMTIVAPISWHGDRFRLQYRAAQDNDWVAANIYSMSSGVRVHSHSNSLGGGTHTHWNSLTGGNHTHNNSFTDVRHDHDVDIDEEVSDGTTINATQISSIRLYHYNGATWDLKHEITNTGKIVDFGLDISNGGQYPDESGYWIVETRTNNSSPDLVKSIVNLKHKMDN